MSDYFIQTLWCTGWWAGWFLAWLGMAAAGWICWSGCGLGEKYFSFLPDPWRRLPFWDAIGLALLCLLAALFPWWHAFGLLIAGFVLQILYRFWNEG